MMDIRESILIRSKHLWISLITSADYNFISEIPLKEFLKFKNYKLGLINVYLNGYKLWVNK